jgi:hypothetical protein
MKTTIVLAVVAAASVIAGNAAAIPSAVRWFHSPSGNIQCEVASYEPPPLLGLSLRPEVRGTYAYCQTFEPRQTAILTANGRTSICVGPTCSVGDGPEDATVLPHGLSIRVGIFRCTSAVTGISCFVIASGRGFRIARQGVVRVRF